MIAAGVALALRAGGLLKGIARSPGGRLVLACLMVVVAIVAAYLHGQRDGVRREKAAEAKRQAAAIKVVQRVGAEGARISADVGHQLDARKVEIRTVTKTLTKEVPVYVTVKSDLACVVPDGFVRLHDAATHGVALPAAPGGLVEAPSGVPLSAVAETIVGNYGLGLEWRAEALAWRGWYARQADLWNKNVKAVSPP